MEKAHVSSLEGVLSLCNSALPLVFVVTMRLFESLSGEEKLCSFSIGIYCKQGQIQ